MSIAFLDRKNMWFDEVLSVDIASSTLGQLLGYFRTVNVTMAGYLVPLHFWLRFGSGDASVRLLSVASAVATIPVLFLLGRRLFGTTTALLACLFMSTNAFFIRYAQEARAYSMVVLAVVVSAYFLVRLSQDMTYRAVFAYAVSVAGGLYIHPFALLASLSHAFAYSVPRPVRDKKAIAGALLFALLLASPLLLALAQQWERGTDYVPPRPNLLVAWGFLIELGGGPASSIAYLVAVCAGAWALAGPARRRGSETGPALAASLLLWLAAPAVLTFLSSLWWRPTFINRYLIICLPATVLLAARGVVELRRAALVVPAMLTMTVLSSIGLAQWYAAPPKEEWRSAARYISSHLQPGDGVLVLPEYASGPMARELPNQRPLRLTFTMSGEMLTKTRVANVLAGYNRVWLVLSPPGYHPFPGRSFDSILGALAGRRRIGQTIVFEGQSEMDHVLVGQSGADQIRLVLYESGPSQ